MDIEDFTLGEDERVHGFTVICFSHLRWNFVFQRPQHLLSKAAADNRVYFVEEPVFEENARPHLTTTISPEGVSVVVPVLPQGIDGPRITRMLKGLVNGLVASVPASRTVLWYYTPMALPFTRHLSADLVVYDNMDELSAFRGAHPRMLAMERELFRRAGIVFTGGQSLYEAKRGRHGNVHAFPSSIDKAHFGKARRRRSADLTDQAAVARPRLGFFGVIDERMDVDLVARAAALRPDWQFVMIGPVVKIDPETLPRLPNIHWLGTRSYQDLPAYLAGWDVGIMPFALNESTRFISPTKTPEFLAAGVPVVSTAITDVVRPYGELGLVEIAEGAEDFVARAETLLAGLGEDWLARVDRHLSGMSWDQTWDGMTHRMAQAMKRPDRNLPAAAIGEAAHV